MIKDVREIEDAAVAARRLLNAVESPIPCAGRDLRLTGSIGIVVSGADGDAAVILSDADTAMFQAKRRVGTATRCSTRSCTAVRRLASLWRVSCATRLCA